MSRHARGRIDLDDFRDMLFAETPANTPTETTQYERTAMMAPEINSREGYGGPQDHQYGRRVEADRSWTVYHVFTGVPADCGGGGAMTGLSRTDATDRMLRLNRRAAPGHRKLAWLNPSAVDMPA